ncbi:hypothetical protein [Saccharothrix stipae]
MSEMCSPYAPGLDLADTPTSRDVADGFEFMREAIANLGLACWPSGHASPPAETWGSAW